MTAHARPPVPVRLIAGYYALGAVTTLVGGIVVSDGSGSYGAILLGAAPITALIAVGLWRGNRVAYVVAIVGGVGGLLLASRVSGLASIAPIVHLVLTIGLFASERSREYFWARKLAPALPTERAEPVTPGD